MCECVREDLKAAFKRILKTAHQSGGGGGERTLDGEWCVCVRESVLV